MPRPLRIATVNVNGVRAAYRKGHGRVARRPRRRHPRHPGGARRDRRPRPPCSAPSGPSARRRDREGPRGRRDRQSPQGGDPPGHLRRRRLRQRRPLARGRLRGRRHHGHRGQRYVHSGRGGHPEAGREVQVPRAMHGARLPELAAPRPARCRHRRPQRRSPHSRHQELEGQREARRLPARTSAPTSTVSSAAEDEAGYNAGAGLGWVDVGRQWAGEVRRPVHLVVLPRPGLRQRHRVADRLPAGDPGSRRQGRQLRRRPRCRPTISAGRTTRPSSSTITL